MDAFPYSILKETLPLEWGIATDFALTTKQTNDATAIQPFAIDHASNLYLAEPLHFRMEVPDIIERLLDCCEERDIHLVGLEKGQIHRAIAPDLERRIIERGLSVTLLPMTMPGDKAAKARILQGRMQRGQVYFERTPFFEEVWLPEFLKFQAGGRHDDLVDAAAMAAFMVHQAAIPNPPEVLEIDDDPADEQNWTYESMKRRIKAATGDRRHVPRTLVGEERKPRDRSKS